MYFQPDAKAVMPYLASDPLKSLTENSGISFR